MKCPKCESNQISKNGHRHGKQNYICKQCGRQFVEFHSTRGYSDDAKKICLRIYANGMGFRAIERATGISHNTIINWVRQTDIVLPDTSESEENSESVSEINELDKLQIFVGSKKKIWLMLKVPIRLLMHHLKDWRISLST